MLTQIVTVILVIITLTGVALGRYRYLRMNRATIALVGATMLVVIGAISLDEAYAAIDLNTLVLLFGMMIINANLRIAGFFTIVNGYIARHANGPRHLLALIIAAAGILSALFLNDTIVLMFTPLVIELTAVLKRNPIPYLIAVATAANIGSVATITGNPQNMLIGMSSGISFTTFSLYLTPVALVGLAIIWVVIVALYRQEFKPLPLPPATFSPSRVYKPLLKKSLIATGLMVLAFIAGVPIPLAVIAAASLLLITRRLKPERVFREIDWVLLVFFAALFVVTGAIETSGLSRYLFNLFQPIAERGIVPLTLVSVLLSNTVSNVPAVMLFRPLVAQFSNPQATWLTLAMATTLAGNLTLLGSVANLIVAETARSQGVFLSFSAYLWAGLPITLLSLIWGVLWLWWVT